MSASLFSLSSKITPPSSEKLRCTRMTIFPSKPLYRVGYITNKVHVGVSHSDCRKLRISSQLKSERLKESYAEKKQLEATPKMDVVRTLLIDNYDSYTYNIYQELTVINKSAPFVVHNDEWTWEDMWHYLYEEKAFDNIVISPGPGSPTCPDDIGICLQLLLECKDIPILGVCLGHQALGYAHGAQIVHACEPVHGRLSEIEHSGYRLFDNIPSGINSGFKVVRYHSFVIDAESLPKDLIPIAWTSSSDKISFTETPMHDFDCYSYDNLIQELPIELSSAKSMNGSCWSSIHSQRVLDKKILMGIMHSTRPHYGVQFHPESVATCYGKEIFKNFKEITLDFWKRFQSPVLGRRKDYYTPKLEPMSGTCLQVPNRSFSFRGVHRSRQLGKSASENYRGINIASSLSQSGRGKYLKLTWKKFNCLSSQVGGARKIFCELFGDQEAENTFWLDSSSTEKRRARFSFMGGKGGSLWRQLTFRLSDQSAKAFEGGGHLSIEDTSGSISSAYLEDGFLDFLNKELKAFCYDAKDYKDLPFDFHGGYVGYIGYGLKVECGAESNQHKSRTPDACFFFADNIVVIDHHYDDVYLLSICDRNVTTAWLDETEQKLLTLKTCAVKVFEKCTPFTPSSSEVSFLFDKSKEQYIDDVEKCLRYIKNGESYELCLTTQMRRDIGEMDTLGFYLNLREKNPSPYAAWLNFTREKLSICCSSPERFLRLDRNGILEAKPIKGTIARGVRGEEDELLKLQLQHSEKDRAENLMIVDLLRNDMGRVCEAGSVHVPHLMEVESYATVHTMVSTVRGNKKPNVSAVDCVRAAFPGGSMTGAPKLRSMKLLDSLESCARGVYSGCIGYFSYNQTFDLNIVIRTVVIHGDEASVGSGGAIVSLSNPETEYEEMILKARAPVQTILEHLERSGRNP